MVYINTSMTTIFLQMPSGEDFIRGLSLTFTSVTRHHSGNYVCSADNGFGDPTDTYVKLDVQRELQIISVCVKCP